MQNPQNINERFAFSARSQRVYRDMLPRLRPNREREDTRTGPACNGKVPFLDVFEELGDTEPYEVCLATAIVRSWHVSPVIIYPMEAIVGVTRPEYPYIEHFSFGIQHRAHILKDPAYAPRAAEYEARFEALRSKMLPLDWNHITDEGNRIFGHDVYEQINREGLMWTGGYQGHTVPSYSMLLQLGIGGLLQKIEHYRTVNTDTQAQNLYRSCTIVLEGMSAWIGMYATEAHRLAQTCPDEAEKACYVQVEQNCRAIAEGAPTTLYQAAQLMWFYCLWDWSDCVGRMDQYFAPFYEKAVREGDTVPAEDSVCGVMLKMLENGIHNVTLAGVTPTGEPAENDLTFLLLQILRTFHDTHPRVSVRFHEKSPAGLMDLVTKMWAEGMSDPSVVSDDNVIRGLVELGTPLEDARDYTMLGCQEIEIPGKSNFGCEDGSVNLAKIFEYSLRGGRNKDGMQIGEKCPELTQCKTFEEVFENFARQIRFFVRHWVTLSNLGQEIRGANFAKLVKTPLTYGCIERGIPHDCGGPIYNYGVVETCGSSAVGDSLYAIRELVFEKGVITAERLLAALDADFVGYERERQMLLHAPKFGNDDAACDAMTVRVLTLFWDEIAKYTSVRGGCFTGACSLLEGGISFGRDTGALPDGRFAGEPLGNSIGPRPGADTTGVTALLNSVSRLPLNKGVGGTTLNVVLTTKMLSDEKSRADIGQVMLAYLRNGGQMAQITTANLEDLIDAKAHPERHGDLIIRIGGFSIQFVQLGEDAQNEIISRYAS